MIGKWDYLFIDLSVLSALIPFVFGIISYRKHKLVLVQQLIFILVVITLLTESVVLFLSYFGINNLPIFHLFTIAQFSIYILIMRKGCKPFLSRSFFHGIFFLFIIFALLDAFWLNNLYSFNNYSRPVASLFLIFFALCFFYKTLKELKIQSLEREPLFWLSMGMLIYFSCSLFVFLFTNYVKTSNEALFTIWNINAIFNIILNLSYAVALWVKPTN